MPTYFPQVNSYGSMTQRPYSAGTSFNSVTQRPTDSRPYSWLKRGSGLTGFPLNPLFTGTVNFQSISDAEKAILSTFFDVQLGRLGEFIFLDPGGNLIPVSEDFTNTSWTTQFNSVSLTTAGVADPFGGTRASTLTAGSNGSMTPIVVPAGSLPSGFVMCCSAYVKALSAGQSLAIGLIDSSSTILGSKTWALPQNQWLRIYCGVAVNTSNPVKALFGGSSSWNSTSISFFGPQVVPLMGPGPYKKSPEGFGLHANCRFDVDELMFLAKGPNESSLSLPILETNN